MLIPPRSLKAKDIDRARCAHPWDFSNDCLYSVCRRHPKHVNNDQIIAKLLLIGRAYSAAIERKSAPNGTDDLYIRGIGPAMCRSRLDDFIAALPDGRSPWADRLANAVLVHGDLMKTWSKAGAKGKRSLASKYLHFHRRDVFPLFDSRAARGIRRVTPDANHVAPLEVNGGDNTYSVFCRRYLWLLQTVRREFGVRLSLRQADRLLLAIANE